MDLRILPVSGVPEVAEGTEIGSMIAVRTDLESGDVVVLSQKIVSKAEGQVRRLGEVTPDAEARRLARQLGKDPAVVALALTESVEVLRAERGVLITRTHHGFVCANAGIDSSNLAAPGTVALLPRDPDASARRIRSEIESACGARPAVVISDSFGRAWRIGQAEVAIGCAGLLAMDDWRGRRDRAGRELTATQIAIADEAAGAADLVRDKSDGTPVAVIRGLERFVTAGDGPGAAILRRSREEDLFGA